MQAGFLDGEAYARGTTVYLQDRRLDMLPSLLSEHLCSLRAGVDRCAVSVLWTLNADLSVESIWFGRSMIRCTAVCVLWTVNVDLSVEAILFGRSVIRRAAVMSVSASYAAAFVSNLQFLKEHWTTDTTLHAVPSNKG